MKMIIRSLSPIVLTLSFLCISISLAGSYGDAVARKITNSEIGTIQVTTLEDEILPDGNCSLREAIEAANSNTPVDACAGGEVVTDTITFSVSGTITVTSQLSVSPGGPLVIDGGEAITTSGNGSTRVWWVEPGTILSLKRLVIANGYVTNDNGAGLYNNGGFLTIDRCVFRENKLTISDENHHYGGGIYSNSGMLNVFDSGFVSNGLEDKYSHGGGIANLNSTGQILRAIFQGNRSAGCWQGPPCSHPGGGGYYQNDSSVTIQDSTFISNTATFGGGGLYNEGGKLVLLNNSFTANTSEFGPGAGMTNSGEVVISDNVFRANVGSGMYTWHSATISNSTFIENHGPGIINGRYLSVTNSTFSGNHGGIYNNGTLSVDGSTFLNNSTDYGGGIENMFYIRAQSLYVIITNCTFSENTATEHGGGVYNIGLDVSIANSTFFNNSGEGGGGGIYNEEYMEPFAIPMTVTNTIIDYSPVGGNCLAESPIVDGGHNISSDSTCDFNVANGSFSNTNPRLEPLQDNGGSTMTHGLEWGSPAIDAGDPALCPATDQRGVARPLDGNKDGRAICDIGSYELEAPPYAFLFFPMIISSP